MSEQQKGVFTLKVPLDRDNQKFATYQLREMDEATFMAARSMIESKKDFEACRFIIRQLRVSGDTVDMIEGFVAVNSASKAILELIRPLEAELKKN